MDAANLTKTIYRRLAQAGWRGKIVSIAHLDDLRREIDTHHQNGLLDEALYREYLAPFDFDLKADCTDAKALVIVSAAQPQQRVAFRWQDQVYPCIIPPTYNEATDHLIKDVLEKRLRSEGYYLVQKRLPAKILAVRSGLARYGKNNITYVPPSGSFHRLVVFATDLPCLEDSWGEAKTLKVCDGCTACMAACPSGAIAPDRFLLHAERCITFHNERHAAFPVWLKPAWHNCLVGCMCCQNACPMNRKLTDWIEDGITFDTHETALFIQGVPKEQLGAKTIAKLAQHDMMAYVEMLGRNLGALIARQR